MSAATKRAAREKRLAKVQQIVRDNPGLNALELKAKGVPVPSGCLREAELARLIAYHGGGWHAVKDTIADLQADDLIREHLVLDDDTIVDNGLL